MVRKGSEGVGPGRGKTRLALAPRCSDAPDCSRVTVKPAACEDVCLVPADAGRVRPIIDQEFGLEDLQAAHEYMESNASTGKVVVRVD
jgi:NADPH:quinone reductase-like Zn-dependent oxidoreductase